MDIGPDYFKPFLENYKKELVSASFLLIDYADLAKWNNQIANEVLNCPDCILPRMEQATLNYADKEVSILIKNSPLEVPLQALSTKYLGKLCSFEGIVSQVVPTYPMIKIAAYKCSKSGKIIKIHQEGLFLGRAPRCGRGGGTAELMGHPETTYIDVQDLGIQEKPENLKAGQVPMPVKLRITKKALINGARAGDVVKIDGILKEMQPTAATRERIWGFYIDVIYIDVINKDPSEIDITPEQEQEVIWLAQNPNIYEMIMESIAPSIYGCKEIKEAIMYQLFGGCEKHNSDGTSIRGTIHILWIDNPSKAKSQMSMRVRDLTFRGVYVAGGGASGAGLTAAVIFLKNKKPLLEAGALVIANKGICCVDEIEKMRPEDRVRIHEAMAQGFINIQKAGYHYTLSAKTAIFGTGNPTFGRYDLYRTVKENVSLPATIISRFDLIFVGKHESNDNEGLVSHILRRGEKSKAPIETELLKKFVAYAKRIKPEMTEDAIQYLGNFYLRMTKLDNEKSPVSISPRQLEAMQRIAEASAKIRLSDKVEKQDAKRAIDIMMKSLEQVGIDPETGEHDIDALLTGIPKNLRDKMYLLMNILKDRKDHSIEDIVEELESTGLRHVDIMKLFKPLLEDGTIYSPRNGYYRRTK